MSSQATSRACIRVALVECRQADESRGIKSHSDPIVPRGSVEAVSVVWTRNSQLAPAPHHHSQPCLFTRAEWAWCPMVQIALPRGRRGRESSGRGSGSLASSDRRTETARAHRRAHTIVRHLQNDGIEDLLRLKRGATVVVVVGTEGLTRASMDDILTAGMADHRTAGMATPTLQTGIAHLLHPATAMASLHQVHGVVAHRSMAVHHHHTAVHREATTILRPVRATS